MTTLFPVAELKPREVGICACTVFVTIKVVVVNSKEEVAEVTLELVVIDVTVELLVEDEPEEVTLNPATAEPSYPA